MDSMNDLPYFTPGKTILWQQLHRSIRLRAYSQLVGERISYLTYFMRDNNQPPAILNVVGIAEMRTRGAGSDRAFLGLDDSGKTVQIAWTRIVEVTLLERATSAEKASAEAQGSAETPD